MTYLYIYIEKDCKKTIYIRYAITNRNCYNENKCVHKNDAIELDCKMLFEYNV